MRKELAQKVNTAIDGAKDSGQLILGENILKIKAVSEWLFAKYLTILTYVLSLKGGADQNPIGYFYLP